MTIRLTKEQRVRANSSQALYAIMQQVFLREQKIDRDREHFWIMGLANDNTLLFVELIGLGSVRRVGVEPMDVYSLALQKRAVRIVLVHNHPSGNLRPSEDDEDLTDYLIQIGVLLNVPVLDHLIISEKSYYSFTDSGLLGKLEMSRKHVLPYQLQARLMKDIRISEARGKEEGLKEGRDARTLELALALKAQGVDANIIAAATGLSVAKVSRLSPGGLKVAKPKGKGPKAKGKK